MRKIFSPMRKQAIENSHVCPVPWRATRMQNAEPENVNNLHETNRIARALSLQLTQGLSFPKIRRQKRKGRRWGCGGFELWSGSVATLSGVACWRLML